MSCITVYTYVWEIASVLLENFGPDYRFLTRVVSDTEPINGILKDDLWIIGVGDPLLMTSKYAERYKDPFLYTDIKDLALGISKVQMLVP
mgnify:CR=1 FL=1